MGLLRVHACLPSGSHPAARVKFFLEELRAVFAVLLYLEHTARHGEPVPLVAKNDNVRATVRIVAA